MGIHLVVLVHGLWGTVAHFDYVSAQLLKYGAVVHENGDVVSVSDDKTVVYRTTTNQGYFTYDGIDVCGTRVANEITSEVNFLNETSGSVVDRISIMGYSLGGLVSRYAAGVLHRRDFFKTVKPVTFTTFCTPHVGVVVLSERWTARAFNGIGSISMASTSKQLFLTDRYSDTGGQLLLYMSDPKGPFYQALKQFETVSLYANVVNDHRCEYYTAGISSVDPFQGRTRHIRGPFVEGYKPTVLELGDTKLMFEENDTEEPKRAPLLASIGYYSVAMAKVMFVIPLWFVAFALNATYQNVVSSFRQRAFRKQGWMDEVDMGPSITERLEEGADDVVESMYRAVTDAETASVEDEPQKLQLDTTQLTIIDRLNTLNWRKYPVHITKHSHAHAAVLIRYKSAGFSEGKVVVKHWIESTLGLDRVD